MTHIRNKIKQALNDNCQSMTWFNSQIFGTPIHLLNDHLFRLGLNVFTFFIILFTLPITINAEILKETRTIIKHEVKKGETIEDIASKYRVTVKDIQALNPYTSCYTGISLDIPLKISTNEAEENKAISENSDYYNGQLYLDRKDYKKSIEHYSHAIENGNAAMIAYYNRGIAWYNCGKLRQAMEDFKYVIQKDSLDRFSDAQEFYDNAYQMQQQRDAEKAQIWGELIGTLVTTAAVVYSAAESNKHNSKSASKSTPTNGLSNNPETNDDSEDDDIASPSKKSGKCGLCAGKGFLVEYVADYGIKEYEYCSECGKKMQTTHWHKTCPSCNGSGTE